MQPVPVLQLTILQRNIENLPRFGANWTSCTGSVIAFNVSTLCHFLKKIVYVFIFGNLFILEGIWPYLFFGFLTRSFEVIVISIVKFLITCLVSKKLNGKERLRH